MLLSYHLGFFACSAINQRKRKIITQATHGHHKENVSFRIAKKVLILNISVKYSIIARQFSQIFFFRESQQRNRCFLVKVLCARDFFKRVSKNNTIKMRAFQVRIKMADEMEFVLVC